MGDHALERPCSSKSICGAGKSVSGGRGGRIFSVRRWGGQGWGEERRARGKWDEK